MSKRIDLTGQRFGRWAVLGYSHTTKKGNAYWNCCCMCGTTRKVVGFNLTGGKSKSCNCWKNKKAKEPKKLPGVVAFNHLFLNYKHGAKSRGYGFQLSKERFRELTKQNCHYCGISPSATFYRKRWSSSYIYNGIDRIDNSKGYTTTNIVPCCGQCNRMKLDHTQKDFLAHVERIHNHQKSNGGV